MTSLSLRFVIVIFGVLAALLSSAGPAIAQKGPRCCGAAGQQCLDCTVLPALKAISGCLRFCGSSKPEQEKPAVATSSRTASEIRQHVPRAPTSSEGVAY